MNELKMCSCKHCCNSHQDECMYEKCSCTSFNFDELLTKQVLDNDVVVPN